ncbi:MAG: YcjX family protein [Rhodospirillales bacterium]|nr:YcjX family protein [Rhodospirillales bacterium]
MMERWFGEPGRQVERLVAGATERLGEIATDVLERASERTVRLAITGLSRSGKTVAATAIVHDLLRAVDHPELLPFLSVVSERRLAGAKLVERADLHLPTFPYRQSLDLLTGEPPDWPESTDRINRSRLALRFRPAGGLARLARDRVSLHLDIVDYPGEWLLDLPMLHQSFEEWSRDVFERLDRPPRDRLAGDFLAFVGSLGPAASLGDETIGRGADLYRRFLHACAEEGLTLLQPGRFVKPGREISENAPMMAFFPLPARQEGDPKPLRVLLERRYDAYRDHIVHPLYRDHFARSDRQVVLVDVLKALAGGPHALADMRDALTVILRSFDHGSAGWLRRIFAPRIDRVLFAATKCDHVPLEQYRNLQQLLEEMITHASGEIRFEGARTKTAAIAAVRCTENVLGEHDGKTLPMVRGLPEGRTEKVALYPGEVPPRFPSPQAWGAMNFRFLKFLPYGLRHAETEGLPHVGLDHTLEFLLGDRLR